MGSRGPPPPPSAAATKLYVGHLPRNFPRRDLEDIFSKYGRILSCEIKQGGFAFIEFQDTRDAEDAISALDGYRLDGERITVEWSRRSTAGSSACFLCGEPGHWASVVSLVTWQENAGVAAVEDEAGRAPSHLDETDGLQAATGTTVVLQMVDGTTALDPESIVITARLSLDHTVGTGALRTMTVRTTVREAAVTEAEVVDPDATATTHLHMMITADHHPLVVAAMEGIRGMITPLLHRTDAMARPRTPLTLMDRKMREVVA
ncbi:hypothetical protein DFJ73DRAFT_778831 [Zopfochytrium polystomum]|nr:hypothetical protein DFJ73DRAFT_778831 [Zopfochytrium polystomum]